jgi:hypothetical protein
MHAWQKECIHGTTATERYSRSWQITQVRRSSNLRARVLNVREMTAAADAAAAGGVAGAGGRKDEDDDDDDDGRVVGVFDADEVDEETVVADVVSLRPRLIEGTASS